MFWNILTNTDRLTWVAGAHKTMRWRCEQMGDAYKKNGPKWNEDENGGKKLMVRRCKIESRTHVRRHRFQCAVLPSVLILRIAYFAMRQIKIFAEAHFTQRFILFLFFPITYHQSKATMAFIFLLFSVGGLSVWRSDTGCSSFGWARASLWLSLQFLSVFRCVASWAIVETDTEPVVIESKQFAGPTSFPAWEFAPLQSLRCHPPPPLRTIHCGLTLLRFPVKLENCPLFRELRQTHGHQSNWIRY